MKLRNAIASIAVAGTLATMSLVPAHAANIYFNFSGVFNPTLGGGLVSYTGNVLNFSTANASTVAVLDRSNNLGLNAGVGTDITVANFGPSNSNAIDTTPDMFNFNYVDALTITPTDVNGVALAGYSAQTLNTPPGNINGSVSANTVTSVGTGFSTPLVFTFNASGQPTLIYTVAFKNFLSFPAPKDTSLGAVQYRVTASSVPEPGAVAMFAGMGVSASLFALKLRKRRN